MIIMNKIQALLSGSLIKFICVGLINTAIDFTVFFFLHWVIGLDIITSNVIAFGLAVTNSYIMNKLWSFKQTQFHYSTHKQFVIFIAVSVLSVVLNTGILVAGEPYIPILYLKILATVVTPLFNYLMYRYVVFRIHRNEPSP